MTAVTVLHSRSGSNFYFLLSGLLAGAMVLIWLNPLWLSAQGITVCVFKSVTGIPCPSCGTGRGIAYLLQGEFASAFMCNPFSFVVLPGGIISLAWLNVDMIRREMTLYRSYLRMNLYLNKNRLAVLLIILFVCVNWLWNLSKF